MPVPKGYKHTAETRAKMSATRTGGHHTEETRRRISLGLQGRRLSPEHCAKISEAKKGTTLSEAAREKLSIALTGKKRKPFTDEHRAKLSATHWRGGEFVSEGYTFVSAPNHPSANTGGYVRRHRLVMEIQIGRYLKPEEVVHHIDGDTSNDEFANLLLFHNTSAHSKYHAALRHAERNRIADNS